MILASLRPLERFDCGLFTRRFCLAFIACFVVWIGDVSKVLSAEGLVRCELIPLPGHKLRFQVDGTERVTWHFGPQSPRPFFFPLCGPQGGVLTRMGHPGAPNHDHHRSVWFANHKINGQDFWSENGGTKIKQKRWLAYLDGDAEAIMAVECGWYAPDGKELMTQELVAAILPLQAGEYCLEFQSTFRPAEAATEVIVGKTNFGFLAVRVAKSISAHFGSGVISSSEGATGERDIFGQRARWMDYSGDVAVGKGSDRRRLPAGITYFDHPQNSRYPSHWHVRSDGWMGASFGMHDELRIQHDQPLVLRYLLHVHSGAYQQPVAAKMHRQFADRLGFVVRKASRPHQQFEVVRKVAAANSQK